MSRAYNSTEVKRLYIRTAMFVKCSSQIQQYYYAFDASRMSRGYSTGTGNQTLKWAEIRMFVLLFLDIFR